MKTNFLLLVLGAVALLACLFLVGCSKDSADSEANISDQDALGQMMADDQDVDGVNAWTSDEEQNGGSNLDDAIVPLRWGRVGHLSDYHYTVEISGDTLATITRTAHFNGTFRVVTDTTDSNHTAYNKPMYNLLVRKARAVRIARTNHPRQNWRIREITPEVMTSADPNPNTVRPTRVQLYSDGQFGLFLIADVTNPLETYFARDTLPMAIASAEFVVRVTVNTSGVAAFAHPRAIRVGPNPRLRLHDDGLFPDEVAGDNIFSGYFFPHSSQEGVFHAAVDIIDHGTLYDSVLPYNATGWSIPFRTEDIIE